MRKIVVLMVAIISVVGFVNVLGAENKKKTGTEKRRIVSLQTFVKSVAGRTEEYIVTKFGKPSCQGHYIFLGMIYDNFVKDERTGEILTVQVLFKIGIPGGTVKIKEGKRVIGQSDFRFVAASVRCGYYTFIVEDANDPVVQNYNIYVKPWQATSLFPMNTQPIPSCEQVERENHRINIEMKQRDREKKEREKKELEMEERENEKIAPFKNAVDKLIGKSTRIHSSNVYWKPGDEVWEWKYDLTFEGTKYFIMPVQGEKDFLECNIREDRYKDGVDYLIFRCLIDSNKKQVDTKLGVYRSGEVLPVRFDTYVPEPYTKGSPIDLIVSTIRREGNPLAKIKTTEEILPNVKGKIGSPVRDKKFVTVTWTFVNIRSGAGNDYSVVASVNQGDKLIVIRESGEWLNVRSEDGKEGWISNKVVK
jgi:hypothetical protein